LEKGLEFVSIHSLKTKKQR